MSRRFTRSIVLSLFAWLVGITSGQAEVPLGRTEVRHDAAASLDGQVCLQLRYPSDDPDWVRLYQDGREIHAYFRGVDVLQPPRTLCVPTGTAGTGRHEYRLLVGVDGATGEAVTTAESRPRVVGLTRIVASQPSYRRGEVVVLDLEAIGDRTTIAADFSAMDSAYRPGSETVTRARDGSFRIRYQLSPDNTRGPGRYPVGLTLTQGTARTAVPAAIELSYLPRGRSEVIAEDGLFVAAALPVRAGTLRVTLESARLEQASVTTTAARGATAPSTGATASSVDPRRPFSLRFVVRSAVPLRPDAMDVELFDRDHDGYWSIPVDLAAAGCDAGGCRAEGRLALGTSLGLGMRGDDGGAGLAFRLVTKDEATTVQFVPGLWLTSGYDATHVVRGTVRFEYRAYGPDIFGSIDLDNWPQYAAPQYTEQVRAARRVKVVLQDGCGHYIERHTDDQGSYEFAWLGNGCGNATITAWTLFEKGIKQAAVGKWIGDPVASICTLTDLTSDYLPHSYQAGISLDTAALSSHPEGRTLNVLVPDHNVAAKAFFILDNMQTALDYFDDIAGVSQLPKLNVVYSPGLKPANWSEPAEGDCDWEPGDDGEPDGKWDGEWARYLPGIDPGFIFIPAESYIDYGWLPFAQVHEAAHYFHRHYVRTWDYGRFGEPMANAHAAAILGTRWMVVPGIAENLDVNAHYSDRDGDGTDEFWQADMTFGQNVSMGWAWRLIFDLIDPDEGEPEPLTTFVTTAGGDLIDFGQFDAVWGGGIASLDADYHDINDVLMHYLGGGVYGQTSPDYQDRGVSGPDLVDIIDGMLCRGHATDDQIEGLVDAMAYGYDFGVGAGSCQ